LVSCNSDTDCTGIADGEFNNPPNSVHQSTNRYCGDDGYCAISDVNSCCGSNYRGIRPFEAVEARIIRELVNNVPFAFVLDMHSSRSDLGYRYFKHGGGGTTGDPSLVNGRGLRNEMAAAYNDAAGDAWNSVYTDPTNNLPLFITLDPVAAGSGGSGQLPGWTANKPTWVWGIETLSGLNPTYDNFDNETLRAVTSFTWELGAKNYDSTADYANDFPDLYGEVLGCDSTSTDEQGGRPRSTFMTINQVEGAKGLMSYLADQAQTPGAGYSFSTGDLLQSGRRDAAVVGLKIHDGHGRGVQQSELRWTEISNDPTAEIVIPAGYWTVSTEVATAVDPATTDISGSLDVSTEIQTGGGWVPHDMIFNNEMFSMWNTERRMFSKRFHFMAGQTYRVTAKVVFPLLSPENDTLANDKIIMKFKVLDCMMDEPSIPNGLDSDDFCQKGLPFKSDRFACRIGVGTFAPKGVCKECWLTPFNEQMCPDDALCVSGMCDDKFDCISGLEEDLWEGAFGSETVSWVALSNDDQSALLPRTLHRDADTLGNPVQDIDTLEIRADDFFCPDSYAHTLNVKVVNNCSTGIIAIGAPVAGLKAKIQGVFVSSPGPFVWSYYQDLTVSTDDNWVDVTIGPGLDVILPGEVIEMMAHGRSVRVLLKNDDTAPQSFPYRVTVGLSSLTNWAGPPFPDNWPLGLR
jgi:hypothetical protein